MTTGAHQYGISLDTYITQHVNEYHVQVGIRTIAFLNNF